MGGLTATYFPRFAVGANSDVTARAVNSLIPAPIPANTIPPMKIFISCAVLQMIMPTHTKAAPVMAT